MTVRTIRALALAGTMTLLAACTSSTTSSVASPPSSAVSVAPVATPSPSATPAVTARWEVVSGVDAVSPSFTVVTLGACEGPRYDARCRQHLMATQDAGRTWYELTPPGLPRGAALEHPDFLDPSTGWVVSSDCAGGHAALYGTSDGGRTWASTNLGPQTCNAGAAIVPDFVDPAHGWLLHVEPTAPFAVLERTTDGGKTWRRVGPRMQGAPDRVTFTSTTTGWMSGMQNGEAVLARSTDGGRTWSRVGLPPPPKTVTSGTPYPDVPTALPDGSLVEPVTYRRPNGATVVFDRSTDAGATWSVVRTWSGHAGHRDPAWGGLPVVVAAPGTPWIAPGPGGSVVRGTRSGWSTTDAGRAPLMGIASASPRAAWVVHSAGRAVVLDRLGPDGVTEMRPWPASPSPSGNGSTSIAALGGVPSAIAGAAGSVYVAIPAGSGTVIERIGPTTGRVLARSSVPVGVRQGDGWTSLAAAGGALWFLVAPSRPSSAHPESLLRLDPITLRVEHRYPIAHAANGLATTPEGVWVGEGDRLQLLTAGASTPVRTIRLPGAAATVAASPDGGRIYAALRGPTRNNHDPLLEVDAWTGSIVAQIYGGEADLGGFTRVVPTDHGLWVGVATGMMGSLSLLRPDTLASSQTTIGGTNGIGATFADGWLWVSDYQGMSCNDPRTGRMLGYAGLPGQLESTVVQAGVDVVTVVGRTLYRIDPSVAC